MNPTAILPNAAPTPHGQDAQDTQTTQAFHPGPVTNAPFTASQWDTAAGGQGQYPGGTVPASAAQAPAHAPVSPETTRVFAILSFVLGIASIVSGWTFVAPIAGLVLGILALRRGSADRTFALWGVWLNGIMLGLTVLISLFAFTILGIGLFSVPFFGV